MSTWLMQSSLYVQNRALTTILSSVLIGLLFANAPANATLYLVPEEINGLKNTLFLNQEGWSKTSAFDRALVAAYRINFALRKSENIETVREQAKSDLSLNDDQILLAEAILLGGSPQFAERFDSEKLVLLANTINKNPELSAQLAEYLDLSNPAFFKSRFTLLTNGLMHLPIELQNQVAEYLEAPTIKHIQAYDTAQKSQIIYIETLAMLSSAKANRHWLVVVYAHFIEVQKEDVNSRVTRVVQKIAQLLAPQISPETTGNRDYAKQLNNSIFARPVVNEAHLDALDYWYGYLVSHRLVSPFEHKQVVTLYKKYFDSWVKKPSYALNSQFEFRLVRYLGFLAKPERLAFLTKTLYAALDSHNFTKEPDAKFRTALTEANNRTYLLLISKANTDEEKAALEQVYINGLKKKISSWISLDVIQSEQVQFARSGLARAKKYLKPTHYYDFVEYLFKEVMAHSNQVPTQLKADIENEYNSFGGKRPRSRDHLKLVDCNVALSG